jgi:hypothetical protein
MTTTLTRQAQDMAYALHAVAESEGSNTAAQQFQVVLACPTKDTLHANPVALQWMRDALEMAVQDRMDSRIVAALRSAVS